MDRDLYWRSSRNSQIDNSRDPDGVLQWVLLNRHERIQERMLRRCLVSPPAFYKHARTVQRKLFATLFDENNLAVAPQ